MNRASFSVRPLQSSTNENTVPLVFSQEDPFHFSTLSPSGETLNTVPVSLSRIYVYDTKSPLSKDSLQQNKNDVNPSNRYSLKKEIKVKNGEVQNLNELIPYAVDAKFFTADDAGNKTTDINYQWVRDNLNSRIKALYTRTNFAYLPELNSTENTIQKRNKIAHQLLEAHTIQNMLVAEQSNLTLQEVIKLNDQAYKNLRLYVRNMFAEMERNVQHSMITDIHDKIGKIREMYKLQQSQVQYKYNHPEQVKMMLEVLSSFRDGVITHDKKTGTKRLNAKNIRNQVSNLLMEVDIKKEYQNDTLR